MMNKLALIFFISGLFACEDKESQEASQNFEEWRDDYMNARQGDSTEDVCAEFYQDCVDAGYPEEACAIRLEECAEWAEEREEGEADGPDDEGDECEEEASSAYEDCLNEGGTAEDCREVYAQTYEDCTDREEGE